MKKKKIIIYTYISYISDWGEKEKDRKNGRGKTNSIGGEGLEKLHKI